MRRQYRSFVVTMVVVSLCCGFVGCKLTPGGKWYKPTSYSFHNPFKKTAFEDDDFGRYAEENNGISKPKDGQSPDLDLTTPAGGYSGNQVAQNTNRSTNVNVPNGSGGYAPNQNPAVAMNNPNQQVVYQNPPATYVPQQGQPAVQNQYYPNQPTQNPYPQNYNAPAQVPYQNSQYQQPQPQPQQYGSPANQAPVSNGYATGQSSYSDEYYPSRSY